MALIQFPYSFRSAWRAALKTLMLLLLAIHPCRAANLQDVPPAPESTGLEGVRSLNGSALGPVIANPAPGAEAASVGSMLAGGTNAAMIRAVPARGVNWSGVLLQSALFLSVEQGYRLGTQPGTREALKGKFFDDWFKSVKATKGWGDGDDFLTNYIGHPMEGSVAGFIFVQNDPRGRNQIFNWNSWYWKSRLKSMAWTALYSTQFELGPISEASIGNVGYQGTSQSGAVDLVVTPLAGLGWQVGEDALDKYLVMRIENWTRNPMLLMLARSFLNPTRSFANAMRMHVPWHRDTRSGIWGRGSER